MFRVLWGGAQAGGSGGIQTPIHAWNLDGSPWDDAIGSADLTVSSGSVSTVTGKISNGVQFSGANFLQSAIDAVPVGDVSFSFGIWVYLPSTLSGYQAIASVGNNTATDEWQIYHDGATLYFVLNTGEQATYDFSPGDQWYYLKAKRNKDTDTMAIAVNNDLIEYPFYSGAISTVSNARLRIGRVTRTTAPLATSYADASMIFDGGVYYQEYISSGTDDLDWNLGDGRAYP